jgi:tRNA nucleotidyltransferase (CCA-adding enzyme)
MQYIKSCGVVAFKRINNEIYYLIIKQTNNDYGFPKGRIEANESELDTAIRELKEETNIEVNIIDNFRVQIEYKVNNNIKKVVYFLGECINENIIVQEQEVLFAKFLSFNEALDIITYNDTKNVLIEANKYINKE